MVRLLRVTSLLVLAVLVLAACSFSFGPSGSVFDLRPGDCFDDPATDGEFATQVDSLTMLDCDTPHDNEVFANFEVDDGAFPGIAALDDAAGTGCPPLFESYVGSPYEDTAQLDIMWLSPTAESWAEGDRTVTCVLYDAELAELTESQAGTGS